MQANTSLKRKLNYGVPGAGSMGEKGRKCRAKAFASESSTIRQQAE
jgi:hypothetical protein